MVRDSVGTILEEGDEVLLPIGNSFVQARVVKLDSGLGAIQADTKGQLPPAVPVAYVQVIFVRQAVTTDGRVADLIKFPQVQEKKSPQVLPN